MNGGAMREGTGNAGTSWSRLRASRWFRPLAIAVPIVVVIALALGAFGLWRALTVPVPDLAGKWLSDASDELGGLRLTLQAEAGTDLSLAEYALVDSQDPAPGARVVPNSVVTVTTHLGNVSVPDLSGRSYAAAEAALEAAGLRIGPSSLAVPADLQADSATIEAAFAAEGITAPGLAPGSTAALMAPEIASDWPVTAQEQAAATEVVAGTTVGLTVTVPFTPVPDVGGQSKEDAIAALQAAGFDASGIAMDGVVTEQSPAAGTPWIAGAEVGATLRHQVRYEASANFARGWMQWIAPGSSEITVDSNAKLPWSMTWWDTTSYGHVVVGPKAVLGSGATASCRILVDGVVVAEQSATGTTPNVTCG